MRLSVLGRFLLRAGLVGNLVLGCGVAAHAVDKPYTLWNPASTSNYTPASRTSAGIDSVVIHTAEGSYAGTISWFKNPVASASSHYVISPSGEITQMVADDDIAWTQTYYNSHSIGIECAGYAGSASTWTPAMLEALAHLVAWLCEAYDVAVVHPDTTANHTGGWYTGAGILGHYQIQPSGSPPASSYGVRTDPGPYFPWSAFIDMVNGHYGPGVPVDLAAESWLEGDGAAIHFSWSAAGGADGYWLDLAADPAELESMTGSFEHVELAGTEHTWGGRAPGTTYWWRVFAYGPGGGVHGYPAGPVTTPAAGPPGAPVLYSPAGASTLTEWPVVLDWEDVSGATEYEVGVWRLESDGAWTLTHGGTTGASSYAPPVSALPENGYHVWTVRAANAAGYGEYSEAGFTLELPAPPAADIVSPAGYAKVSSDTPTLTWGDLSAHAVWWRDVRIWRWTGTAWSLVHSDGDFGGAEGTYAVPAGVVTKSGYYWWAVRVHNAGGASPFAGSGFTY